MSHPIDDVTLVEFLCLRKCSEYLIKVLQMLKLNAVILNNPNSYIEFSHRPLTDHRSSIMQEYPGSLTAPYLLNSISSIVSQWQESSPFLRLRLGWHPTHIVMTHYHDRSGASRSSWVCKARYFAERQPKGREVWLGTLSVLHSAGSDLSRLHPPFGSWYSNLDDFPSPLR